MNLMRYSARGINSGCTIDAGMHPSKRHYDLNGFGDRAGIDLKSEDGTLFIGEAAKYRCATCFRNITIVDVSRVIDVKGYSRLLLRNRRL